MRAITQMQMVQGNHLSTFDLYTMSMFFGGACNAFYAMFMAFFRWLQGFYEAEDVCQHVRGDGLADAVVF